MKQSLIPILAGMIITMGQPVFAQQTTAAASPAVPEKVADGIIVPVGDGLLKLEVCAEDVVRVAYARDRGFFQRKTLATEVRRNEQVPWSLSSGDGSATLSTSKLKARVNLASGAVTFLDASGQPILAEKAGRMMNPAEVQGEKTFHIRQEWEPNADEALYGLGQNQLGLLNIKGYDIDLWQHNATVIVPFLVSSRGYGILWDNTSYSRFGDLRPFEPIPAARLFDAEGRPGGLTGSYFTGADFKKTAAKRVDARIDIEVAGSDKQPNKRIHPDLPPTGNVSVRWEGEVEAAETGDHLFQTYSGSGLKLWVDGKLVMDHWRQGWLPWFDVARVRLEAGHRYRIKLEWTKDQGMETVRLLWKTPTKETGTSLWSEVGDGIDYYFVLGPELDRVVAGYRRLTGDAPVMPRWAYGFWQCRERYKTAQEVLDVLKEFRTRHIPVDNVVMDWQYWKLDSWGSHQFDPARFPDPEGWIRAIHDDYHAQLMISVWGKFYPGTANFEEMRSRGFLYEEPLKRKLIDWLGFPYTFYDAFNPAAGKLFWSQVERDLFRKKVDAWWMDATEPDLEQPMPTLDGQRALTHPNGLGSGARMLNAYSLANSKAIYEGQRAAAPDQRVFILTRSGFAGQQRNAAATWSGDITATWTALRKQIPAGLGFAISGIPYWTTDIGGFAVPMKWADKMSAEDAEEWRELNTRWFQFGAFCPLFRVHGQFPFREMWNVAPESHPAYQTQLKFDRLRYQLLPYIYSLGGAVTHDRGTIMRPLVMDFRTDTVAREVGDQFLFGPAFLVSPVMEYKARSRSVYLPKTPGGWYDFWTGEVVDGGKKIEAAAPFESMPLHVKAGSIIPTGPDMQYTGEKAADPVTLRVYAGADGAFTLYEDEGLNYNYEKGAFTRIPIRWNDAAKTLVIGTRAGSFPGMLKERTFQVVWITRDKPAGFSFTPAPQSTVKYTGQAVELRMP